MSVEIEHLWEHKRDSFTTLLKADFDAKVRAGLFALGPLRTNLSDWAKEFGSYSPRRWAFGELKDGQKVCTEIA